MEEGTGGQKLGGMIGGAGSGAEEWKVDRRDRWEWAARNSSAEEMLSLRVSKVSSLQARVLADCC